MWTQCKALKSAYRLQTNDNAKGGVYFFKGLILYKGECPCIQVYMTNMEA